MNLVNKTQNLPQITATEALKRKTATPTIVVIGPTSSGKSTFIYTLINLQLYGFISKGIGDKSQTTIIPTNFLLDSRIEDENHFAIKIEYKKFSRDLIHTEIYKKIIALCLEKEFCIYKILSDFNDTVFEKILEPTNAKYHLSKLKDKISLTDFKEAIFDILCALEKKKENFNERVKNTDGKKGIKQKILEEFLGEILDSNPTNKYSKWLESIEEHVRNMMYNLFGDTQRDSVQEYSLLKEDDITYGGNILAEIFNPYFPYSLLIENITLACKPQKELVESMGNNNPIRFCLRDTMGLNQISMNGNDIERALDIALNCSPDSILLLMSLTEREDVIEDCCNKIAKKLNNINKNYSIKDSAIIANKILFTKVDIFISNIINKEIRDSIILKQTDYDKHIKNVIYNLENSIDRYAKKLNEKDIDWVSLRYLEYDIDPIQRALKKCMPDKLSKFKPEGLYPKIQDMIQSMQKCVLPNGVKEPITVTVKDTKKPPIEVKIRTKYITERLDTIKNKLVYDDENLKKYIVPENVTVHGKSVNTYYDKLQKGIGHKTKSEKNYNFNINMKRLIEEQLLFELFMAEIYQANNKFTDLFSDNYLMFSTDNVQEAEINRIIDILETDQNIISDNDNIDDSNNILQIKLCNIFEKVFTKNQVTIVNRMAFNLSYRNKYIKDKIDEIYYSSYKFDTKMKNMQNKYREIFASKEFKELVIEEFNSAITDIVNKIFMVI